jgi:hypothetical protein
MRMVANLRKDHQFAKNALSVAPLTQRPSRFLDGNLYGDGDRGAATLYGSPRIGRQRSQQCYH